MRPIVMPPDPGRRGAFSRLGRWAMAMLLLLASADAFGSRCVWQAQAAGQGNESEIKLGPYVAWTGSLVFSWGFDGGGLFDPARGTWQAVPPTHFLPRPLPDHLNRRDCFFTGTEILVWVSPKHGGALFNPLSGEWRPMSSENGPPPRPYDHWLRPTAWTGTHLFVSGAPEGSDAWLYDPAADSWSHLPPTDLLKPNEWTKFHRVGTELVVVGGGSGSGCRYVILDTTTWQWESRLATAPICPSEAADASFRMVSKYGWLDLETSQHGYFWNFPVDTERQLTTSGRSAFISDGWIPCPTLGCPTIWAGSWFVARPGHHDWIEVPPDDDSPHESITKSVAAGDDRLFVVDTLRGHVHTLSGTERRWMPASRRVVTQRDDPALAWTGSELLVWGGEESFLHTPRLGGRLLDDGLRYEPKRDRWKPMSIRGAPTPREGASAVWTGREMAIWGGGRARWNGIGFAGLVSLEPTGGLYDPATDKWRPLPLPDPPPPPTWKPFLAWAGSRILVYGGLDANGPVSTGFLLDPVTGAAQQLPREGAPSPRRDGVVAWTGDRLVVWGGRDGETDLGDGASWSLATGAWSPISPVGALAPRRDAAYVWTGSELLVWGGRYREDPYSTPSYSDGAFWNPTSDSWTPIPPRPAGFYSWNTAATNGTEVLFLGAPAIVELDLATLTWRSNAALTPIFYGEIDPSDVFWTGDRFVVWQNKGGIVVHPIDAGPSSVSLLSPPANATGVGAEYVDFGWTSSYLTSSYDFHLGPSNPPPLYQSRLDTTTTRLHKSRLVPGTTYYWTVRSINDCGEAMPTFGEIRSFQTAPYRASFTMSPSAASVGTEVTFRSTSTGRPTSHSWDFGDGSTGSSLVARHSYQQPGDYLVRLELDGPDGKASAEATIRITAPGP